MERLLPISILVGGAVLFFMLFGVVRFVKVWKNRESRNGGEADLMLKTVDLMVRGVRESESDMRDLYSKAEKRATFLERYHNSILDSMETGVLACNRQGQVTAINPAAEEILNLERGSAGGKRLDEALGRGNLFGSILKRLLDGEAIEERIELKLKCAGDEPRWIELRTSVLRNRSEQVAGATFMLDEITERKLLRRQIELKERLAAMGEVSAGIAHEFRNSIHALNGLAKLIIRRAEGNSRIDPIAREILTENAGLERTVDELLSFLKPQGVEMEEIRVGDFLNSLVLPLRELEVNRSIRFRITIGEGLPAIRADRGMLTQAIRNLVQNGINAIGGEGEIAVGASVIRASGGGATGSVKEYLMVSVCDTGPGIDEEIRQKIFRPFFTTRSEGTGLGLSVVQKAVAAHGGSIEVENRAQGGASFTIFLPTGRTAPAGASRAGNRGNPSSSERPSPARPLIDRAEPPMRRQGTGGFI